MGILTGRENKHAAKETWRAVPYTGMRLLHPSKGGTYEVLNERPLNADVAKYCVNNLQFLSALHNMFSRRLTPLWKQPVVDATEARVLESQAPGYDHQCEANMISAWAFQELFQELHNDPLGALDMLSNSEDEMWEGVGYLRMDDL